MGLFDFLKKKVSPEELKDGDVMQAESLQERGADATKDAAAVAGIQPADTPLQPGSRYVFGQWNGRSLVWRVLKVADGQALMVTQDCLEVKPYHYRVGETSWSECTLRGELNGDYFYRNPKVFSAKDRSAVMLTTNENRSVSFQNKRTFEEFYSKGCDPTEDRVFLLSIGEVIDYFKVDGESEFPDSMGYVAFKFPSGRDAIANIDGRPKPWWLRQPGRNRSTATVVTADGMINFNGFTATQCVPAVRPALWLNLKIVVGG
ncbi:MAG: DUF6273 domain-containing protein [Tannerella sp.]|jgi:hypothetical protein|nr:DUF6273 domain-containing protein [Tannerella sp.]